METPRRAAKRKGFFRALSKGDCSLRYGMKKLRIGLISLLLFGLFSVKIGLEAKMERYKVTKKPFREVVGYLAKKYPEEATTAGIAVGLGFKEVLSDFLFLQSIQYFGGWGGKREEIFSKVYPVLKAMSKLSPHFIPGFSFGALVMEDLGYLDEAINFLNEGIANNPYAFELWLYRDFMIRLFRTHEYKKAIEGLKRAIGLKGHPPILERMLAFAYEKDGQIKLSILQWKKVKESTKDSRIRKICERNIHRLYNYLATDSRR